MWWDTGRHPRRQLSLNNESLSYEYKADEMTARKLFICSVLVSVHSQLCRTQFLDNFEKWSDYLGLCCTSGIRGGLEVSATWSFWRPLVAGYSHRCSVIWLTLNAPAQTFWASMEYRSMSSMLEDGFYRLEDGLLESTWLQSWSRRVWEAWSGPGWVSYRDKQAI